VSREEITKLLVKVAIAARDDDDHDVIYEVLEELVKAFEQLEMRSRE